ncbi:MAG: hypothetical protein AAB510_02530 [Patescibacteria group bacterium]
MILQNIQKNKAFVILFAVVVSSILLSITLGIANIALKELKFTTSARDTNDSFFAADTGIECALMNDKGVSSRFVLPGVSTTVNCGGNSNITATWAAIAGNPNNGVYTFILTGLGAASSTNCAVVTVQKDATSGIRTVTTIVSKGYNIGDASCTSTSTNRIERQLETRY